MARRVGNGTLSRWTTVLVLASAACGGGDGGDSAPEGDPPSLDVVETATVQIEATGTFVDPELGQQLNAAGAGSGFIIDPSGIAVTNNHVVTGAAILQVRVPGEEAPRNARVLGASECSDLAVIDIDGEGFPALRFAPDEAETGLDIFVAGYPLGDPEFTLTRGIVSKASAFGETEWASVDGVIEHDASTNPGNSGGPVVNGDGEVVAIHYAGDPETDQAFAISAAKAQDVMEQLRGGTDAEAIGVNGSAVTSEDGSISGIWVASVKSGSPADEVGVQPGDVITKLEQLALATDGTMREYCDVLRSRGPDDQLAIEVLRFEEGVVLEGQLNGRPLEVTTSFGNELAGEATADEGAADTYAEYTTITDETGAIEVEVPTEWSDVDGAPYVGDDGLRRIDVRAAPDLESFAGSWDTPGMIFTASSEVAEVSSETALLDELQEPLSGQCTYDGRQPYEDPLYTGFYDVYSDCGGVGATYVVIGAVPPERDFVIRVQVQANSDRDFDALDRIIDTFQVTGEV